MVVVLSNANAEMGIIVAKRISARLRNLQIPHSSSQVSKYVSLRSRPETSYDSLSEYIWKVLAKNPKLILDDFLVAVWLVPVTI